IDITKKGIDKAYGIKQLMKLLSVPKNKIIFVGDALHKGGNDYVVKNEKFITQKVSGPKQTKFIIQTILAPFKTKTIC
ncbi:MAG: HAD hydrolase family protein, partial [Patescibacteria group bacterium]